MLASLNLVCAVVAYSFLAYALARLRWNGRGIALVLLAIILCAQVWLVPQLVSTFVFRSNWVLFWTWFSNWLVSAFAVVSLWQSLKEISRDRADAARLDGCGPLGIYWHVVLPLVRQQLLLLAFFIVMGMGGALLLLGLEMLRNAALEVFGPNFLFLVICSSIMTIPLIAIFFIARKLFPAQKFSDQL